MGLYDPVLEPYGKKDALKMTKLTNPGRIFKLRQGASVCNFVGRSVENFHGRSLLAIRPRLLVMYYIKISLTECKPNQTSFPLNTKFSAISYPIFIKIGMVIIITLWHIDMLNL